MNKNNYDNSSTGYDCELTVMLDHDVSRMDFENEFHVHQHDGYRTTCVLQFGIQEIEPVERCTDLFEFSDDITEREYRNALYRVKCNELLLFLQTYSPRDFFEEYGVGEVDWKETFMDELDSYGIIDYAKDGSPPLIDELKTGVTHKFRVKASCGHSQGDYALVLVPNEHGWDGKHKDAINETIDNTLWNSPVYALLEVTYQETGGVDEIYLDEFLDSPYDWDRDKVIDGLKKREPTLPPSVVEWVEDNLPEYPTA